MNIIHKTLTKTLKPTIFKPSTSINGFQFSLSSLYSTKPHFNNRQFFSPLQENLTNTPSNDSKFGKTLTRPSEIPYQPKVANWVNFIGTVEFPVSFFSSIDGDSYAGTVVCQSISNPLNPKSHSMCIPVIFQGDLAHTAATHLKKNAIIYIVGHLSLNPVPIKLPDDKLKVMVHDLYFVRGFPGVKNGPRS